jgi:ribosome-associated translation inhibitor RaiA
MESIEDLRSEEKTLLSKNLAKEYFDIYIWPNNSKDIPDTMGFKLIILTNLERCKEFLENCGERPRVYRNTLIFLCPSHSERINFENWLKKKLAWQLIEADKTLRITEEQRKEVREKIKKAESEVKERIRSFYRLILLPSKDGFKEIDLGIPTYGEDVTIDKRVYERLKSDGEILEKLSPLILKEKYLKNKDYVKVKDILESFYKTPGEIRLINDKVLKDSIKEGVKQGLFGVGRIEEGKPVCSYFKEECASEILEEEIIIRADLCIPKHGEGISDEMFKSYIAKIKKCEAVKDVEKIAEETARYEFSPFQRKELENEIRRRMEELQGSVKLKEKYKNIHFKVYVPPGKLSQLVQIIPFLQKMFNEVDIKVEIFAKNGEISKSEYEDKIKEAINQAGVKIELEDVE